MKKIFLLFLWATILSGCQEKKDNYSVVNNDNVLILYNNDTEVMKLSGDDMTWEKEFTMGQGNEKVYSNGKYVDGYERTNEKCLEPISVNTSNMIYYAYENSQGIMFFCKLDLDTMEAQGIYAEQVSDEDAIYNMRVDGDEVSFMHTLSGDEGTGTYENIIKTKLGDDYAVPEFVETK